MKNLQTFEEFLNESYAVNSSNLKDLIKSIKGLPETVQFVKVPDYLYGNSTYTTYEPSQKDWKKKLIKHIEDLAKTPEGKSVDEFVLRPTGLKEAPDSGYFVSMNSDKSRAFADSMRRGDYGSLD